MTRKLIRGRSKQSVLVLAGHHVHLFVWIPKLGADSMGFTLRVRQGEDWGHWRITFFQRGGHRVRRSNPGGGRAGQHFMARPTLTLFEAAHWRTYKGTQERVGLKSYVRLKIGPGGRQL